MYNAKFISDKGETFVFGKDGGNAFDIEGLSGITVDLGTSQGFSQIGESVETQTIKGKSIEVDGVLFGDIQRGKERMRRILAPLTAGRLVFQDKYYVYVYVKDAPTFSPIKNNGTFMMRFYAPYPFFRWIDESVVYIGGMTPMFSFPVNYAEAHQFGRKSPARYANIFNSGDVKVPYRVDLTTEIASTNIVLTNLRTLEYLKINGAISAGDKLSVYRDENSILRVELTKDGATEDVLSWLDEGSTLFDLAIGDNVITANDDENGEYLTARIIYNPAVVSVYET